MAEKAIPFKIKPFIQDEKIADAVDVETTGNSNVQSDITNLQESTLSWIFNGTVLDATNPGADNLAFNNAVKDNVTIVSFNTTSNIDNARFDEFLASLIVGDRIFIQERVAVNNSILFRVVEVGGQSVIVDGTKVNVNVVRERDQGGEFTNGNVLNVTFFTTGRSTPPAQSDWLQQTSSQEIQSTQVTNIAPTVADVLIWRRSAVVQQGQIDDPGVGVIISEANRQSDGTFDRASGTSVYDDDLANAYIYIGITNADVSSLNTAETFLEARRNGVLVFSSSLDDLIQDPLNISQFKYWRTTNNEYHYIAGDNLEVVTRSTSSTTEYNYNSPAGDFTANINNLPITAVDDNFTGRVLGPSNHQVLVAADRVKLTGLLVNTVISASQTVTALYKHGVPTADMADYSLTWNEANPVLGNFGSTRTVSILVDNNVTVGSVTGGATLGPQLLWIPGKYIYEVTIPAEVSTDTPTSHLVQAIVETFAPTGFDSTYKVVRANIEQNLLNTIDAHGSGADISALETKVNNLFPLTPDVDILVEWANIFDPIHGAATVDIVDGYSLIADYRSNSDRYESAGITFGTGSNVITYSGLTQNLHRSFGFAVSQVEEVTLTGTSGTANINVNSIDYLVTFNTDLTTTASDFVTTHSAALDTAGVIVTSDAGVIRFTSKVPSVSFTITAPVNASGNLAGSLANVVLDKTLLWIVDGGDTIPFIDITSAGNIRINNYTPAETVANEVSNQFHFLNRSAGTAQVSTAGGSVATYPITNFPASSTNQSRSLQIDIDVFLNGTDTEAAREVVVSVPTLNAAQSIQTLDASIFLGPLHGNRTVDVTIGYEFRVVGPDLVVDLTLEDAPGDVTVSFDGSTAAILNYTSQAVVARVDNFLIFQTAGGDYSFSGRQEFILSMRPTIGASGEQTGYLQVVPATVGSDGIINRLNDRDIRIPTPLWTDIEVADDVEFRTFVADHYFVHSEVASLLTHRGEKWAYGLARLQTDNAGHSITEAVDLAAGTTLNGSQIEARSWRESQSFTAVATNLTVNLPNSPSQTQLQDFDFIEVTWHTGVGTATDNDNRNYTEMGSMHAIINGTDAEIILGGRGRGADNFGIEITVPSAGTETSLVIDIVNLNDAGGAALPAGSLITAVRFY